MKSQSFLSIFALSLILLGFQNCGNFSAMNASGSFLSSHDEDIDVRDMEKRDDIQKLYYYYGLNKKTSNTGSKYVDVMFDLDNKKAELNLKLHDELAKIKKTISLSSSDVEAIREALDKLKLSQELSASDLKGSAEEYIISYFSDNSSYLAHIETLKEQLTGLSVDGGKELLTQTLNRILANKLDISLLDKFADLMEKKKELKSLIDAIKNYLKSIKISIENTGNVSINIQAGSYDSTVQKEI